MREQGGRHLHVTNTASHAGSRKAGKVADYAAAQRHHEVVAFDTCGDDSLAHLLKDRVALGRLTRRYHDVSRGNSGGAEGSLYGLQVMGRHRRIGNDCAFRSRPQRLKAAAQRRDEIASDHDVIGAFAECDRDHACLVCQPRGRHDRVSTPRCLPTAAMISSTTDCA